MDCSNLMAFWDGLLSEADADAFRAHFAECEACFVELGALMNFDALVEQHRQKHRPWWRRVLKRFGL